MYEFVTRDTTMSVVRINQCPFYSVSLGQLNCPYAGVRRAGIPLYKGTVPENWLILVSMVGDQLASHAGVLRGARFSSLPTSPKNTYVGG